MTTHTFNGRPLDSLLPHQQRVAEEENELGMKIIKLASFLNTDKFKEICIHEQLRLSQQLVVMERYQNILQERIAHFA